MQSIFTRRPGLRGHGKNRSRQTAILEACEDRKLFSTYTVTTTADAGTGSLRDAIKTANSHHGTDVINFKIGAGTKTIKTVTALPYISDAVTIDGTTQPGYAGRPIIELDGEKSGGYGLTVGSGNSTIKGLVINRYKSGILLVNGGGNTVKNCYIGTGVSGVTDWGNSDKGIVVQTANNTIGGTTAADRNVISGNGTVGVQLYTATAANNKVLGNYIGTNYTGEKAIANGTSGVAVVGAPNAVIGGVTVGARNVISGNAEDGIVVNTSGATNTQVMGNIIGLDAAGTTRLGNGHYGVETSQGGTIVGGTASGSGNVISGNGYSGVVLWLSSGGNAKVLNNYIGTDDSGTKDVGNLQDGVCITNGSSNNLVRGNLISGNDIDGVMIYQGTANVVQSNTIGFDVSGKKALANSRDGIRLNSTAGDSLISNFIGFNKNYGIYQSGGGTSLVKSNTVAQDVFNL